MLHRFIKRPCILGLGLETEQAEGTPQAVGSPFAELLERRRVLLTLGVLLAEVGIFAAGILTPLSESYTLDLANQTSTQFASVPTATPVQLFTLIFTHNIAIGLFEMVPVVGALLFVYSIYVTGLVAQALSVSAGYPGPFGAILFVFPYTTVELSAYAIAVAAGIMLLVSVRRKSLARELKVFAVEMGAVALVLLAAAVMETATRFSSAVGLALWAPTGLALAGVWVLARRRKS